MFWRVSGLNTASPVDSILDKESYSLEELLDEDELIQECKSLNARLTAYLKQKETVNKLVRYLVEPPPPDADPKRSFKYPFTACEIFCCEVEGIFNTLLEHEDVLGRLFSILESPRPLNCMLAGYFSRVMGSLLLRRTQDVMQYLQRHQDLLLQLVEHVDTTSIAEVLVRLVGADEQRAYLSTNYLQWLSDTNLLYLLLDKLQAGQAVEAQSNSAEILAALAQSQVSPLTRNLADPAFLELLVQRALPDQGVASSAPGGGGDTAGSRTPDKQAGSGSPPATIVTAANGDGAEPPAQCEAAASDASPSEPLPKSTEGGAATGEAAAADGAAGSSDSGDSVSSGVDSAPGGSALMHARVHALNVCIALVEPLPPSPADQQAAAAGLSIGAAPSPGIDTAAAEVHAAMRGQATRCVAKYMHRLVALLESADPSRRLPTSYGLLHPPVGLARLKAMELLAALLHSGDETAEEAVLATQGVQRCMELFLAYPFNNVLHRHVASLVTSLEGGSTRLATFLVQDCGLLQWLVTAPTEVAPAARPGDEHAAGRRPLRAGYAGHVTQISNRLIQIANEGQQQLRAAMEGDPGWQAYVKERLEPRNAQENVFAWKCGRPTVHEPVVDAEAAMFQTELDFGSVDSDAFSRDVYQRYGVFSPSGEEEEVDVEQQQPAWAMELANAAGTAGGILGTSGLPGGLPGTPGVLGPAPLAPPAPSMSDAAAAASAAAAAGPGHGKLPMPSSMGPQTYPVYDTSSSSSSSSSDSSSDGSREDEEEAGRAAAGSGASSEEGEVTVAPAPDSDLLLVNTPGSTASSRDVGADVAAAPRLPLGSDDADMADDAVMLEYDAAEQLVCLAQLSLEDHEEATGDTLAAEVVAAAAVQQPGDAAAPQEDATVADAVGLQEGQEVPAAAAEAEAGDNLAPAAVPPAVDADEPDAQHAAKGAKAPAAAAVVGS
ncbi:hypothetical protein D9Q98_003950 [Chlorella vulgaris]|uniref:SIT4 phosphatase-associated family protein n=1 Tax=Chlorella vulgaris TaxID=3077 RepID=A0A9D4TR01_CHLVU|nr:hypothetical protein D9Q98_003950 [Chlorella vulgaris]